MRRLAGILGLFVGLALFHGAMQLLAGDLVPPVTNGLMFVANLYVSFCGFLILRDCGFGRLLGFAVGYLLLFALLVVVAERDWARGVTARTAGADLAVDPVATDLAALVR